MTLVDPVSPNASKIYNIVQNSGFVIPSKDRLITQGKQKSVLSLGAFTIEQIDSDGTIEKWVLQNRLLKDFSDLDYESDELQQLTLELDMIGQLRDRIG